MISVSAEAAEALRLAQARPVEARARAEEALHLAHAAADLPSASVAERALGLVGVYTDQLPEAVAHLTAAVRLGQRAHAPTVAAQARITLAYALAATGATRRALRQADLAAPHLDALDAAHLDMQRGLILCYHLGRLDEALEIFRRVLPILRQHGDRLREARLLCNRGMLYAYRGEHRQAEADLLRAARLCDELGQELLGSLVRENLGFAAARRGDVLAALRWYGEAEAQHRTLGATVARLLRDRAELLLSLRLTPEAAHAAEAALLEWERLGEFTSAAEARLLLAEVALLDHQPDRAYELAETARRAFARQRRAPWQAHARHVALRAALADPTRAVSVTQAPRVARELEEAGWKAGAAAVRLISATMELTAGRVDRAREELRKATHSRRHGTIEQRARAWHAEALLRLASGQRRGAAAAVSRGLRLVEENRAALGATDLRASLAAHRAELADLGLRIALADGRPRCLLEWAERGRSSHLMLPRVRPPEDDLLAADLAALRGVVTNVAEALRSGKPTRGLLRRQAELEATIQQRARTAVGSGDTSGIVAVPALVDALGHRALVEYVQLDGRLLALTVAAGRCRRHDLGSAEEVQREVVFLTSGLRRLALTPGGRVSEATRQSVRYSAERLDALLLRPLDRAVGDRPLVLVPVGVLQLLPWAVLPRLRHRPFSVVPSASVWHAAAVRPTGSHRSAVAAAGPGLPGAVAEAAAVAELYPQAELLTAEAASVDAVTAAFGRVDVVHLAAHGRPRGDNPLFSHLQLDDGPLTVYDLERLNRVAPTVILSACDAGQAQASSGNELLGLATAFLSLRCTALVAPLLCIPDMATVPYMVLLHEALARGQPPAEALAQAREKSPVAWEEPQVAVDLFVCYGAG